MTRIPASRAVAMRRWALAASIYLLAVFHRTSLGVAGLQASSRFHIGPSELSVFVLLQLGVYAGMQIPTGILVDRFGPRRLLITASLVMGGAQLLFAVAGNYPTALLARGLLGFGDALTFVSVLRFAAGQFSPARYPLVVSATAMLGTVGNVIATLPLSSVLRSVGWTPTFAVAGALSLVSGVGVYLMLPGGRPLVEQSGLESAPLPQTLRSVGRRVQSAWTMPGTKAGFWVHFTTMSTSLMFGVLWGVPFMVDGQGMSRSEAGAVLLANVVFGVMANLAIGYVTSRRPALRVPLAIAVSVLTIAGWLLVLGCYSGPVPRPLLIGLIVFTSVGGPASAIGFSMARDYNAPALVGTATGVVNVGGFVAGTVASLLVGWTLDVVGATDRGAYRLAFAVAMVIQIGGLVQMVHWWLKARRAVLREQVRGGDVPVPIVRRRWDLT
ncbi:MAG: Major facilitator superfamily permease [Pseudonocardiales bacterium]|nr:Major facilitator superfamily permease [Pseudonocardiales bacterium]